MRYIGSKAGSLHAIDAVLKQGRVTCGTLCDPFAGTCTVAKHFKARGARVITGDVLALSHVLQIAYLVVNVPPRFQQLKGRLANPSRHEPLLPSHIAVIEYLNSLPGIEGFITHHYSPAGPAQRLFFTVENAMRVDAVRCKIEEWNRKKQLGRTEKAYLLASLLEASDRVANTAGTYYGYLKGFYRKARKPLRLLPLDLTTNQQRNVARRTDAESLVREFEADVLYLDPPYNARRYGSYYHLPETLVRWDGPEPTGRSGVRSCGDENSPYYRKEEAEEALARLVSAAQCKCILFHYAVNGIIPHKKVLAILRAVGRTTWSDWQIRKYSSRSANGANRTCRHRLYACLVR